MGILRFVVHSVVVTKYYQASKTLWLKELVRRYVVEEMLPLSTVDLPSFGAIINKIPVIINTLLGYC